ncbi:MAG: helix-turn-helix transcriptional regulator [Candidatus Thermoplasmatota archaeon]|jgi:predicted ArsR family transcriptional regulator|nr:helix-turn-helix transcriptional regulator [Candidatus Thermoplasmatota archaeon]MCL5955779.1 helix-turn-helix transcriptional regulator [Candidatus Thermoplasmatota archaeon]
MEVVHAVDDDLNMLLGKVKGNIITELSYSERSMDDLSHLLKINKNAVKEHMESLELKGYVKSFFRGGGAGRPRKFYELTEKGMNLLPKKYVSFASMLVEEIESEFGRNKVNEILGKVADKIVSESGWTKADGGVKLSREDKISKLNDFVSTLNKLGYYAKLEVTDDVVRIIRHNCIFYELAKNNSKIICSSLGSEIIKNSINQKFDIKERFSDGNNKCVVEVNIE